MTKIYNKYYNSRMVNVGTDVSQCVKNMSPNVSAM